MSETPPPPPPPSSSGDEPTPTPDEGAAPQTPPTPETPPPPPAYGEQPPAGEQGYAPPPAYGQPAAPQQWAGQPGVMTPDEKTWGGAAHWSALIGALIGGLAFLGPLLVLLIKGNESPYIRAQAVESLNFQITMVIAGLVSFVLLFVLIGFILLPIVGIWWLVFTIIGSVKASNGEMYRYPATIRMVS